MNRKSVSFAPRLWTRAASARAAGKFWRTWSPVVLNGESAVSWIVVGRSASSSGATAEGWAEPRSAEAPGRALPAAASLGWGWPAVPAAPSSPIAVATACVMVWRSDGLAEPASAIWPISWPTRKSVVFDPVAGLVTSYASPPPTRFTTDEPAAFAAVLFWLIAVAATSP